MNDHTITQEEIDMANENIRLEKENATLRQELEAVKVERDEALHCMMVYANEGDEDFESLKEAEAKLFALQTAVEKEMGADCMRNGEHRKVRNSILGAVDDSREGEL